MATRTATKSKVAVPLPSLGGTACEWIEALCVHGPGDVRGEPAVLTPEQKRFIWSAYEIWPRGHVKEGRRRWRRAVYSRRKGSSKSELLDWLIGFELLGEARFDGWDAAGNPVGRPVRSPFIPVAATSEEQADDTLWGAFYCNVSEGPLCDEYPLDIALDRVIHVGEGGEAKLVTSRSVSKDGGKPTFSPRDETHLWYLPDLRELNETLIRNLNKRSIAQPWAVSATTMFRPGQGSVAEHEYELWQAEQKLPVERRSILFDHLDAAGHDLETEAGVRAGLEQASGDAIGYTDLDELVTEYARAEKASPGSGKRYWANLWAKTDSDAIDLRVWDSIGGPHILSAGDEICVGFDGSRTRDSSAMWACRMSDLALFKLGLWERPLGPEGEGWTAPVGEVQAAMEFIQATFRVVLVYGDPWGWQAELDAWGLQYGQKTVLEFPCNQATRMVPAVESFVSDMVTGALTHEHDPDLRRHIGNAVRLDTRVRVDDDQRGWIPAKRTQLEKIDAFLAALLAHSAARYALANGLSAASDADFDVW